MNDELVKRIAEKWLPYKPFQMRDERYDPVDLNFESRKACESAIREALEAEWVSVEDRMPEFAHDVLKCDEFGYQSVDYIDPDTGEWSRGGLRPDRVKFWRELPKAPAETEGK